MTLFLFKFDHMFREDKTRRVLTVLVYQKIIDCKKKKSFMSKYFKGDKNSDILSYCNNECRKCKNTLH